MIASWKLTLQVLEGCGWGAERGLWGVVKGHASGAVEQPHDLLNKIVKVGYEW